MVVKDINLARIFAGTVNVHKFIANYVSELLMNNTFKLFDIGLRDSDGNERIVKLSYFDIITGDPLFLEYCSDKKYAVEYIFEEVGSGLNDNRRKLLRMMKLAAEHKFDKVIIEHYDRLTRFNYNLLVEYFNSHGVAIEYTESVLSNSFEADLVKDMLSLLAVFSAKLYSQRGRENRKTRKAAAKAKKDE